MMTIRELEDMIALVEKDTELYSRYLKVLKDYGETTTSSESNRSNNNDVRE